MATTPNTDSLAEVVICPQCCRPNPPEYDFCAECNAPLSSRAAILPTWRPWAEGYLVRRAVKQSDSWFKLAGVWLIFAPQILLFGVFVLGDAYGWKSLAATTPGIVGLVINVGFLLVQVAILLLFAAILWLATRNFIRLRAENSPHVPAE